MPEAPELYRSALLVNELASKVLFTGQVVKSEVSKNVEVDWNADIYSIKAESRGKEIKLVLKQEDKKGKQGKTLSIMVHFGMSGLFRVSSVDDLPKHSHLRFFTKEPKDPRVLSFVDQRRFGRWTPGGDWDHRRGPDPLWDPEAFRKNVLENINNGMAIWKKPICEAMLNQAYFNGIGNYLRSEILFRANIRPFEPALEVLQQLPLKGSSKDSDLLDLCHTVPMECVKLDVKGDYGNKEDRDVFMGWIRCYMNKDMNSMFDHNKRMVFFPDQPGKLAPKGGKVIPKKRKITEVNSDSSMETASSKKAPKKTKKGELDYSAAKVKNTTSSPQSSMIKERVTSGRVTRSRTKMA